MNDEVLILDPDRAQVRRLQHLLFDLGATVAIAHSGADAARYVDTKGAPKALVMNLDLPDRTAFSSSHGCAGRPARTSAPWWSCPPIPAP